ncbi:MULTISPECIES: hypothetical protein [unclassified Nocardioides]|nr:MULTISPECIES: hypothetical protein [unclassified Nocardioides]
MVEALPWLPGVSTTLAGARCSTNGAAAVVELVETLDLRGAATTFE